MKYILIYLKRGKKDWNGQTFVEFSFVPNFSTNACWSRWKKEKRLNMQSKSHYHSPRHDLHKNLPKSVVIFKNVKKKLVFAIFYFFTKLETFKNYERFFLFHLKSLFHSWDIYIFVFPSSPLFLCVSHCFMMSSIV